MSTPPTAPAAVAAELVEQLPPADAAALAAAASEGRQALLDLRARAAGPVLRAAVTTLLPYADRPEWLAGALAGAGAACSRAADRQSVVGVWTGPESDVETLRLTSAVVVDLIGEAASELLIVSFAAQSEPHVVDALQGAAGRSVDITLVVERTEDNPGFFGSPAFTGLRARRLAWSAHARPRGAALHAKLIVVDARLALVGSANLTERGLDDNLECGVLLRGGDQPRAMRDHVFSLWRKGVLEAVD